MKLLVGTFVLACVALASAENLVENREIVCEHYSVQLRCPMNTRIHVRSADYGRINSELCRNGHYGVGGVEMNPKTPCSLDVTKQIKARCRNKLNCKVHANNGELSDPCIGIYKLLTIDYVCKDRELDICEGTSEKVRCPFGKTIEITSAIYGRENNKICQNGKYGVHSKPMNPDTPCAKDVAGLISDSCNGERVCDVAANNDEFTDPCGGVYKFAKVSWKCNVDKDSIVSIHSRNVCEHQAAEISCPAGEILKVQRATYGRRDSSICSDNRPSHQLSNITCEKNASHDIRQSCNWKNACNVVASNEAFSHDPCVGTFKYLNIKWACILP